MNKLLSRAIPIVMVTAIVAIACVHEIPLPLTGGVTGTTGSTGSTGATGGTGTTSCDTTTFNFSTVINPLIQAKCAACHGAASAASSGASIDLSTYAKLLPYVTNGRLWGSINHSAGFSAMPKGGAQFSTCELTQVSKWIAGGAKNDTATVVVAPPPTCDTTKFLFSTTIAPLLKTNCITCHSAGNAQNGGIDLTLFAVVQAYAANGKLLGSIKHTAGYSAMPKGMAQLTSCEITQFTKWIGAGSKNDTATVITTPPPPPPTTPAPTSNCSPDTVYFQNTIAPLIAQTCSMAGCHDAITKASGVTLVTYTNIMRYVSAGNAAGSTLYTITKSGSMPRQPIAKYTAAQLTQVQTWINQGAKNNFCTSCDTTSTYSKGIAPLITTYCIGCHSATAAASSGGNINLSTYTAVKVYATSGSLYGSVNHTLGYSAMPKNQAQLSACQIAQFKKWIDAGALNN
jgi:mono/diheme cytochrome c family protein